MFKVSFKDTPEQPSKVVQRFNNKITVVTLRGTLNLPNKIFQWDNSIIKWICEHPFTKDNTYWISKFHIIVTGTAKRTNGDVDNPILAERIAESRAKIKIYRFMSLLLKRICKLYYANLFGNAKSLPSMGWGGLIGELTRYNNFLFKEEEHLNQLLEKA